MASLVDTFIGSALQANQNARDPNAGSGFALGAEIAQRAEQNKQAMITLQQKQQELENTKMDKFATAIEKGQQYSGKAQQNYYNKFLPQYRNALGLQNKFSDEAMAFNGATPENINRQLELVSGVRQGTYTMADAVKKYNDQQQFGALPGVPASVSTSVPGVVLPALSNDTSGGTTAPKLTVDPKFVEELNKAETTATTNKAQMTKQQNTFTHEDTSAFTKTVNELGKEQRSEFKALNDKQIQLNSALEARDRVVKALQKDPSGKTIAPQDVGGMVYSLLHGELGRVNAVELAEQNQMPGIENKGRDVLVKLFGGANPAAVKNIIQRVETEAQNLDAGVQTKAQSFKDQVNGSKAYNAAQKKQLLNGLDPLVKPVYRPAPGAANISYRGKMWTAAKLKATIDANPNDPDIDNAKAALAAGGQ